MSKVTGLKDLLHNFVTDSDLTPTDENTSCTIFPQEQI